MTDCVVVCVKAPTREEAGRIAQALVEAKLAACAFVIAGSESVYRWQGNIETAQECVLHIETRAALFEAVAAKVRSLHSYTCPCIVALPIVAGTRDFLDWIKESTEKQK